MEITLVAQLVISIVIVLLSLISLPFVIKRWKADAKMERMTIEGEPVPVHPDPLPMPEEYENDPEFLAYLEELRREEEMFDAHLKSCGPCVECPFGNGVGGCTIPYPYCPFMNADGTCENVPTAREWVGRPDYVGD